MSVLDEKFADEALDKTELAYYRGAYNILVGRLNKSIADQLQCMYGEDAAKLITDHIKQFDYEIAPYEDNLKELNESAEYGDFNRALDNLRRAVYENELRIVGTDESQNAEMMIMADGINQQIKKHLQKTFAK